MNVAAYYNENNAFAAQWLRNLIGSGFIAAGEVDERSIIDVSADDLRGFTQCHFFAGIGGWSHALRLAGWPDERPVWTGSCPCQPFSAAGKRGGFDDARHLWPEWFRLIGERRPATIFGEQVASPDGLGWLDIVQADLEGADYAVGAADLCAAGIGAPHIRQRLWFVADADGGNACAEGLQRSGEHGQRAQDGGASRLADAEHAERRSVDIDREDGRDGPDGRRQEAHGIARARGQICSERPGSPDSLWGNPDWLLCQDGKWRPVEPGTFPLAHGIPGRVGRLRAYGNAINPYVAAEFILAYCEARP